MLKLNKLSKYYISNTNQVVAGIKEISAQFSIGEFVAITGASGSGKSTLLNVLAGTDNFNDGSMSVCDEETEFFDEKDWQRYRKERIGFVYQDYNLIENYTVYQNVETGYDLNCEAIDKETKKKEILNILKKVGLFQQQKQKANTLSGGQKQRVAIARALAKNTQIILADEPTGNLDSTAAHEIIEILKELSKDKLVIVVTHSFEDFKGSVTRQINLINGRIDFDIKNAEVADNGKQKNSSITNVSRAKNNILSVRRNIFYNGKSSRLFVGITSIVMLMVMFIFSAILEFSKPIQDEYTTVPTFGQITADRLVILKRDRTKFNEADYNLINNAFNIHSINKYDVLSSMKGKIEVKYYDHTNHLEFNAKVLNNGFKITSGRMPTQKNEVLLSTQYGDDITAPNIINEQLISLNFIGTNYKSENIKIVGYVASGREMEQDMYFTEAMANELNKKYIDSYSKIKIYNKDFCYENKILFIVDNRIENDAIYTTKHIADSIGGSGSPCNIGIRNNLFENEISNVIVNDVNQLSEEISNSYMHLGNEEEVLIFNTVILNELISDDIFQISAYMSEVNKYEETVKKLEKSFYVYYPYAINIVDGNAEILLRNIVTTLISLVVAIILMVASLLLIKNNYKYKSKFNAILLSLGYDNKGIRLTNIFEIAILLFISIILNVAVFGVLNILKIVGVFASGIYAPLTNINVGILGILLTGCFAFYIGLTSKIVNYSNKKYSINDVIKKGGDL